MKRIFQFIFLLMAFSACEKDITVDLPKADKKLVIEGKIEPGTPPFVILTKSMGYFDPTDLNTLENNFVHNAIITVSNGNYEATLTEFCSSSFTDEQLQALSVVAGLDYDALKSYNYCVYTSLDPQIFGELGKSYQLNIQTEGKNYTSTTKIPYPVPLDKLWFKAEKDSLGYVWTTLKEPDTLGNCYRWFAMRKSKDKSFIAPNGSAFEDKFVNATTFDFAYYRGANPGSEAEDDHNAEAGYFKKGDTVIVKFCSLDKPAYQFFRTYETNVANGGNPFASPAGVESNIKGENVLGVWAGYGPFIDTLYIPR